MNSSKCFAVNCFCYTCRLFVWFKFAVNYPKTFKSSPAHAYCKSNIQMRNSQKMPIFRKQNPFIVNAINWVCVWAMTKWPLYLSSSLLDDQFYQQSCNSRQKKKMVEMSPFFGWMPNGITTKSPVFKFSSIKKKHGYLHIQMRRKCWVSVMQDSLVSRLVTKKTTERESRGEEKEKIEESIDIPCVWSDRIRVGAPKCGVFLACKLYPLPQSDVCVTYFCHFSDSSTGTKHSS